MVEVLEGVDLPEADREGVARTEAARTEVVHLGADLVGVQEVDLQDPEAGSLLVVVAAEVPLPGVEAEAVQRRSLQAPLQVGRSAGVLAVRFMEPADTVVVIPMAVAGH